MAGFRDLKNRSRRVIHDRLSFPAIYVGEDGSQVTCTVRKHEYSGGFGDMAGFDFDPAERLQEAPKIVSLVEEVAPARFGVFVVSRTEAYRVETVHPAYGVSQSSEVVPLRQEEIDENNFPVPGCG